MGTISVQGGGGGAGNGANKALSNLANTAVNADIIPAADNTVALGSTSKQLKTIDTKKVTYGAHTIEADTEDNDGVKIVQCFHTEQAGDGTAGNLCLHEGTEPPESVAAVGGHRLWVNSSGVLRHQKPASGGSINLDAGGAAAIREQVNSLLSAFRLNLAKFNLMDGMADAFVSEVGVDTADSTNESYDAGNDLYSPVLETETKLLLHCNGTDASTSFPDASDAGHTFTANNGAQVDTADKKFGTGSLLLDGDNDSVTAPSHSDWDLQLTASFTLDFWIKKNGTVGAWVVLLKRGNILSPFNGWKLVFDNLTEKVSFTSGNGNGGVIASEAIGTGWIHIALVHDKTGDTLRIYYDGVQKGTATASTAMDFANFAEGDDVLSIGEDTNFVGTRNFNGWIDEIRLTKGTALWTTGFTPPISEHNPTQNMTLISEATEAEANPDEVLITIFEEDVDAATINTDIKVYASRDDGSNWVQATLSDKGDYETGKRLLVGSADVSGQASDKTVRYKIETLNNKDLKLHGIGMLWN